ncbi:recombinase family protein [Bacillus cereus]|nr:recombinase family protein [Bacillus cereus]
MKVVGYVRVSSESQIENTSIVEQEERIQAYCKAQGWELIKIFRDEGLSGKQTEKRVGYNEMIEYVKRTTENIKAILVLKSDRIHRMLKNLLVMIQDELKPLDISFISVTEMFDTSSPQGMMFLQMIGSFAEFERELIYQRTKGGRISTAKNNKFAGGELPYGYEIVDEGVIKHQTQASIIKRIYQDYLEGYSMYKIAKKLNNEGISPKRSTKWTSQGIKNVLLNQVYKGIKIYDGKIEKNGIVQKGVFPRIVSAQLWNSVNEVIKRGGYTQEIRHENIKGVRLYEAKVSKWS